MEAFKGFTKDLTATLGKGVYKFEIGKTYREEEGKTGRNGFHCCENPFECLGHYPLNNGNRFVQVEASGSIDEDDSERIACTELTLIKELTVKEFAWYGMKYIIDHPAREKWKQYKSGVRVEENEIDLDKKDQIGIARGANAKVKGFIGQILGLIKESEPGCIVAAKLFTVSSDTAEKWISLNDDRTIKEVIE